MAGLYRPGLVAGPGSSAFSAPALPAARVTPGCPACPTQSSPAASRRRLFPGADGTVGPVAGRLHFPACPAARPRLPLPAGPARTRPARREAAALAERVPSSAGPARPPAPPRPGPRRFPPPASCQPNGTSQEALQYEIKELKQKDLALDQETAQLLSEGYSLEELEQHISLLHEYNDIKDAGQTLLGKLAVIRGVTTKQLYPEYDLELSD
ncbi:DNA repair protein SWI5 homolog [Falco peregrinus]|uniref:DNA repair protein SWI5 homolog n=1 Tax=Falco peregrinus TaxID=8954 RepID=UPI002478E10B|nr:DNA repair protein SWI5 homolog [Falco peregrinus]